MSEVSVTIKDQTIRVTRKNERIFIRTLKTNTLQTINSGGSSGVDSFNGRTGVVVPDQADYDPFFLTPTEGNALYQPIGNYPSRYYLDMSAQGVTGTTNEIVVDFVTIPANSLTAGAMYDLWAQFTKVGANGAVTTRWRVGTTLPTIGSTVPGGTTQIATWGTAAGNLYWEYERRLVVNTLSAQRIYPTASTALQSRLLAVSSNAFDLAIDFTQLQYLSLTVQLASGVDAATKRVHFIQRFA